MTGKQSNSANFSNQNEKIDADSLYSSNSLDSLDFTDLNFSDTLDEENNFISTNSDLNDCKKNYHGDCVDDNTEIIDLDQYYSQIMSNESDILFIGQNEKLIDASKNNFACSKKGKSNISESSSLVDPYFELIDPNPCIYKLFGQFNRQFFWNSLGSVEVKWSKRMTLCAGLCEYQRRSKFCCIKLSEQLLKFRPRKDLIETLLHEMIHAYLFITENNRDRQAHGPNFVAHMKRINQIAHTKITIYHSFHDEVKHYRKHWWRCTGPCKDRSPFYGYVKRAMNRAPSSNDYWWNSHKTSCGGTFEKIMEPSPKPKKVSKKSQNEKCSKNNKMSENKTPTMESYLSSMNKSNKNGINLTNPALSDGISNRNPSTKFLIQQMNNMINENKSNPKELLSNDINSIHNEFLKHDEKFNTTMNSRITTEKQQITNNIPNKLNYDNEEIYSDSNSILFNQNSNDIINPRFLRKNNNNEFKNLQNKKFINNAKEDKFPIDSIYFGKTEISNNKNISSDSGKVKFNHIKNSKTQSHSDIRMNEQKTNPYFDICNSEHLPSIDENKPYNSKIFSKFANSELTNSSDINLLNSSDDVNQADSSIVSSRVISSDSINDKNINTNLHSNHPFIFNSLDNNKAKRIIQNYSNNRLSQLLSKMHINNKPQKRSKQVKSICEKISAKSNFSDSDSNFNTSDADTIDPIGDNCSNRIKPGNKVYRFKPIFDLSSNRNRFLSNDGYTADKEDTNMDNFVNFGNSTDSNEIKKTNKNSSNKANHLKNELFEQPNLNNGSKLKTTHKICKNENSQSHFLSNYISENKSKNLLDIEIEKINQFPMNNSNSGFQIDEISRMEITPYLKFDADSNSNIINNVQCSSMVINEHDKVDNLESSSEKVPNNDCDDTNKKTKSRRSNSRVNKKTAKKTKPKNKQNVRQHSRNNSESKKNTAKNEQKGINRQPNLTNSNGNTSNPVTDQFSPSNNHMIENFNDKHQNNQYTPQDRQIDQNSHYYTPTNVNDINNENYSNNNFNFNEEFPVKETNLGSISTDLSSKSIEKEENAFSNGQNQNHFKENIPKHGNEGDIVYNRRTKPLFIRIRSGAQNKLASSTNSVTHPNDFRNERDSTVGDKNSRTISPNENHPRKKSKHSNTDEFMSDNSEYHLSLDELRSNLESTHIDNTGQMMDIIETNEFSNRTNTYQYIDASNQNSIPEMDRNNQINSNVNDENAQSVNIESFNQPTINSNVESFDHRNGNMLQDVADTSRSTNLMGTNGSNSDQNRDSFNESFIKLSDPTNKIPNNPANISQTVLMNLPNMVQPACVHNYKRPMKEPHLNGVGHMPNTNAAIIIPDIRVPTNPIPTDHPSYARGVSSNSNLRSINLSYSMLTESQIAHFLNINRRISMMRVNPPRNGQNAGISADQPATDNNNNIQHQNMANNIDQQSTNTQNTIQPANVINSQQPVNIPNSTQLSTNANNTHPATIENNIQPSNNHRSNNNVTNNGISTVTDHAENLTNSTTANLPPNSNSILSNNFVEVLNIDDFDVIRTNIDENENMSDDIPEPAYINSTGDLADFTIPDPFSGTFANRRSRNRHSDESDNSSDDDAPRNSIFLQPNIMIPLPEFDEEDSPSNYARNRFLAQELALLYNNHGGHLNSSPIHESQESRRSRLLSAYTCPRNSESSDEIINRRRNIIKCEDDPYHATNRDDYTRNYKLFHERNDRMHQLNSRMDLYFSPFYDEQTNLDEDVVYIEPNQENSDSDQ